MGPVSFVGAHRPPSSNLVLVSLERLSLRWWRLFPFNHLPDGLSFQAAESQLHHQDLSSQHQC